MECGVQSLLAKININVGNTAIESRKRGSSFLND
jgi:hypothetical protein